MNPGRKQFKRTIAIAMVACLVLCGIAGKVLAQSGGSVPMLNLYVDPSTKIVYTEPGKGRRLLTQVPVTSVDVNQLEQREQHTEARLNVAQQELEELAQKNKVLTESNFQLSHQVSQITPAWRHYIDNFQDKFRVGTLVYADYRMYTHTGFQPQELTQISNPGPQNNYFNSFDITRTYLNFYFFPVDGLTTRITPNIYQTIQATGNTTIGSNTQFSSNVNGNLSFRLKYAYLQYSKLFDWSPYLKGDTITGGQQPNPLVAWEEDLYGFRYVNLTPWNYYSLSSSQVGVSVQGPIKFTELQYIDYDMGVYNNASFHAINLTNTAQWMNRISVYPLGAKWRFDGLGLTWFFDYGYTNAAPSASSTANAPFGHLAANAHIMRQAFLAHYTAESWGIIFEYDLGHNAFTTGNAFSGSGPITTGPQTTNPHFNFSQMAAGFLNNGRNTQSGFDLMGHVHIPHTPFTAFGLWSLWQPNTKVQDDPLDFQRWVVGVQWQINAFLRLAIDNQNVSYYHSQHDVAFSYVDSFVPGIFKKPGTGQVVDAVPWDTHSIFLNLEFSY